MLEDRERPREELIIRDLLRAPGEGLDLTGSGPPSRLDPCRQEPAGDPFSAVFFFHEKAADPVHARAVTAEARQAPVGALVVELPQPVRMNDLHPADDAVAGGGGYHSFELTRGRGGLELGAVLAGLEGATGEPRVLVALEVPVAAVTADAGTGEEVRERFRVRLAERFVAEGAQRRASRSTAEATVSSRSSENAGPSSWSPTGSAGRSLVGVVEPHGTDMPAIPARLAGNV